VKIQFSKTRKPLPADVLRLYQFAPWASKRKGADVRRMIAHTPIFFTAWKDGSLLGMARAGTDFAFRAVLWDLIVDPAHWGKGIGSRMVRDFLGHPGLKKVESFWLSTTDKQRFYSKFGFKLNTKNIMVFKRGRR
jgi:N-acetylglutamate synthase-like GNAT family acetyltransferase